MVKMIHVENLGLYFDAHTPLTEEEYDTLRILLGVTVSEFAGRKAMLPCLNRDLLKSVTQILANRLSHPVLSEQERIEAVDDLPMYQYNGIAEELFESYVIVNPEEASSKGERLN